MPLDFDFAQKLRITAAVLGCTTQKDLCLHFRRINPATEFDLTRSYNWVQGRSRPRSARVYEDWAALLGTGRSAAFLQSCSVDEFLDVVCARHRMSRPALAGLGGRAVGTAAARAGLPPLGGHLAGAYACYSHAWSPHFRGRIIRGSLVLKAAAARAAPALLATYGESISLGRLHLRGPVTLTSRSIFLDLHEEAQRFRLFMCLFLPAPPAGILAGVMAGATFVDSEAQPAATRIVMVRVPPSAAAALEASNRYLDPTREERLSDDLAALGVPVGGTPAELDALLDGFLSGAGEPGSHIQVAAGEYARLTHAVDRLMLIEGDPLAANA